jgi:hypothetical protein
LIISIKSSTYRSRRNSKSRVESSTAGLRLLPEELISRTHFFCSLNRKREKFSRAFGIISRSSLINLRLGNR